MRGLMALPGLFRLFLWNCKLDISRSMAYRFNFILGTILSLLNSGAAPLVQYLIFTTTNGYPGWSVEQLILFQGTLLLWGGLQRMLFGGVIPPMIDMVRKGEFDRLLVKPYPPIGVILTSGFQLNGVASILAGLAIMGFSLQNLNVNWHWWNIPLFLLFICFGIIFYMSVLIIQCTLVITLVQINSFLRVVDNILNFANYPITIYPRMLQLFFTIVMPFAIWINFPAEALLDRVNELMLWSLLSSVGFYFISLLIWKISLNKYTSAGG
jgi:ABC-2 type transport system permease protein